MNEWKKLMETLHLPEQKFTVEEVEEIIKDYDFVPVVRCKDCKHNQLPPTSANAMCDLWYGMTDLFGYCSSGGRRDEDETD